MKVVCKINGEEVRRDPLDLDFIKFDVVEDFVRAIEHIEKNPQARVEVEMSSPEKPVYDLVNCSLSFKNKFYELMNRRKFA